MAIEIDGKKIGRGFPCYVIAEAGANANSDIKLAFKLIDGAVAGGADAIKFQHYKAEKLVTKTAPKYYVDTLKEWQDEAAPNGCQYDEFSQLDGLKHEDWKKIRKYCDEKGITFLSTPFDFEQIELLEDLKVSAYKIASADITYLPFLKAIAEKGKPVIISTGASEMVEVEETVKLIESTGNRQIVILHCTLHYPCHNNEVNLNAMHTLRRKFPDYSIGLSDHSLGTLVPIVAASVGADMVEKHYTIDKSLQTSTDHFMSVDPVELKEMVKAIKEIPSILGSEEKIPCANEKLAILYARRSLVASEKIVKGEKINQKNTVFKRPGTGIQPKDAAKLLGIKKAAKDIPADTVITPDLIE